MAPTPRLALFLLCSLALALVPSVAAHENNNHGTIKVHDNATAEPPMKNEPHVDCEFWIEGFNMAEGGGTLVFYSWPPTGNMSVVMTAEWSADAHDHEKGGFHFLAGPFTLPGGHYKVEAWFTDDEHKAKSKVFWVHPCEEHEMPPCPTDLQATANNDGSITLTWDASADVDTVVIHRAVGAGDEEHVAMLDASEGTWTDTDTTVGVTYTYTLVAVDGGSFSQECGSVEVTAIPVFPTAAAFALAVVGGALGYAALRRRL